MEIRGQAEAVEKMKESAEWLKQQVIFHYQFSSL